MLGCTVGSQELTRRVDDRRAMTHPPTKRVIRIAYEPLWQGGGTQTHADGFEGLKKALVASF
jgi:hypothetical protein